MIYRFDRVGGVDNPSQASREAEERDYPAPGALPGRQHRGVDLPLGRCRPSGPGKSSAGGIVRLRSCHGRVWLRVKSDDTVAGGLTQSPGHSRSIRADRFKNDLEFEFRAVRFAHSGLVGFVWWKTGLLRPNLILAQPPVQLFGRTSSFQTGV